MSEGQARQTLRCRRRRKGCRPTINRLRELRLKNCRAAATRYEKTARNYLAVLHLVSTLVWVD